MNDFVSYYGQNQISPVSQDISDLDLHFKRRANLYEMLGIDTALFAGKQILEVGAGSGYNSLCFCHWVQKCGGGGGNPFRTK